MTELKTKLNETSVRAFLAKIEDDEKKADCEKLSALMEELMGVPPKMWGNSMVGFGRYQYQYESGRSGEWFVVGFAPRKNDLTIYIMPGFSHFADLLAQLGKHKTGKSCLYIKKLSLIDMNVLRQLLQQAILLMKSKRVE